MEQSSLRLAIIAQFYYTMTEILQRKPDVVVLMF